MPDATVMEKIVSLCKRRAFIYPASEIYGGINGFWDYGPLGVLLKNNIRDDWWRNMVECPPIGPDGHPVDMVGIDTAIIQHPTTWVASGHAAGFADPMTDCRACKARFRADQLGVLICELTSKSVTVCFSGMGTRAEVESANEKKLLKLLNETSEVVRQHFFSFTALTPELRAKVPCPQCGQVGTLTDPKQFNLMFETFVGAVKDDSSKAFLRPE